MCAGTRHVAVLPIPFKQEGLIIALYPLNVLANAALRIEVGMEVFILVGSPGTELEFAL